MKAILLLLCLYETAVAKECSNEPLDPNDPNTPGWLIDFENGVSNTGSDKDLAVAADIGSVRKHPGRYGHVFYCNGNCNLAATLRETSPVRSCLLQLGDCLGFTVSMWIKDDHRDVVKTIIVLREFTESDGGYMFYYRTPTNLLAARTHTTKFDLKYTWPTNHLWHNYVYTFDKTSFKLYVDGKLETANENSVEQTMNKKFPVNFFSTGTKPFAGRVYLDDLRVWTRPFTPDDVMQIFKNDTSKLLYPWNNP